VTNKSGFLAGPFNAWVQAPDVGTRLLEAGSFLRFNTLLEPRLKELAIITVGARWKAEYEWWAHERLARKLGISDAVIEAIGRGEPCAFDLEDERIVHDASRQIASNGQLAESTYQEATRLLGNQGLIELVSLCGFYTLISFTLNAFTVPLPEGVSPKWS